MVLPAISAGVEARIARESFLEGYEALKSFVRERLSPQKTPTFWIWVEQWPLTGSGKIQKFKLREAFESGEYDTHA